MTTRCYDACSHASDGDCDDGGSGAEYATCDFGYDCADCGVRDTSTCGRNGCHRARNRSLFSFAQFTFMPMVIIIICCIMHHRRRRVRSHAVRTHSFHSGIAMMPAATGQAVVQAVAVTPAYGNGATPVGIARGVPVAVDTSEDGVANAVVVNAVPMNGQPVAVPPPVGGIARGVPIDTTGDGRGDAVAVDVTGDGRADVMAPTQAQVVVGGQVMRVAVPPGLSGGQTMQVTVNGTVRNVQIPPTVGPGESFEFVG